MYKISDQQITPKCCQSPILTIIMKIPKVAKIVYRQMPAPRELPQQIPATRGKSLDAKAPGWGQIFGANLRGSREGGREGWL